MVPLLPISLVGGAVKHFAFDAPKERRQRRLAAETTRYSPWTGLKAQPVEEADFLQTMMNAGLIGGALEGQMSDMQIGSSQPLEGYGGFQFGGNNIPDYEFAPKKPAPWGLMR